MFDDEAVAFVSELRFLVREWMVWVVKHWSAAHTDEAMKPVCTHTRVLQKNNEIGLVRSASSSRRLKCL